MQYGPVWSTLYFPLAGFSHGGDATFEMGNFALDTGYALCRSSGLIVAFSCGNVLSTLTGASGGCACLVEPFDSPRYRHLSTTKFSLHWVLTLDFF